MAELTLSRESCEEKFEYPVLISKYEDQSEQRRLRSRLPISGWEIESPNMTQPQAIAYRTFYTTQYGAAQQFTFRSPIDNVLYNVRFDGAMTISIKGGVYRCRYSLKNLGAV